MLDPLSMAAGAIFGSGNRKWHIYRDDELVFEPNAEVSMERYSGVSNITFYIGAAATSIYNAVITAVRVY